MQLADLVRYIGLLKVAVHERDSEEEGLVLALEVGQHLDHPVDHASSQRGRDLVPGETVRGLTSELHLPLILVNLRKVFLFAVDVLPFEIICLLAAQVRRRMIH